MVIGARIPNLPWPVTILDKSASPLNRSAACTTPQLLFSMSEVTLRRLDNDTLYAIFEILHSCRMLGPTSLTCKWVRQLCAHIIFKTWNVHGTELDHPRRSNLIPRPLWPYVQRVVISGPFRRDDLNLDEDEADMLSPLACEYNAACLARAAHVGNLIQEALNSMPELQDIRIHILEKIHPSTLGISWYILRAILSTPQLRHFTIAGRLCHPEDSLPEGAAFKITAPLTEFVYRHTDTDGLPRVITMEHQVLRMFLPRTRLTLQELTLPSGAAPLEAIRLCDWPVLRKFVLRGERPVLSKTSASPFATILGRMPSLRFLALILAEPARSEPELIWPPSLDAAYEWRGLEQFTMMHPWADDELYAHLGLSLLRLQLRCWPRHYQHQRGHNWFTSREREGVRLQWAFPLLLSSDMLRILRKFDAPYLAHLELEYQADASDDQLLYHIASAFPRIIVLRIIRYRETQTSAVPVNDIALSLSSLRELRVLFLHLDFHDLPPVTVMDARVWKPAQKARETAQVKASWATMTAAAETLARALSPSVEHICLLWPLLHITPKWRAFNIVRRRASGAEQDVHVRSRPYEYGDKLYEYDLYQDF